MQIKRSIKYKTVLCIAITVFAVGTVTALLSYHLNKLRLKKSYIESTNSVMEVTHNYLQDKLTEIYRTSLAIYSSSIQLKKSYSPTARIQMCCRRIFGVRTLNARFWLIKMLRLPIRQ